jgi:thiamine pyrophosphokinase
MDCLILLNGKTPVKLNKNILKGKYVICADGAYRYAEKQGIPIDLLIGDFDSLGYVPPGINIKKFNRVKDCTDGEIALDEALSLGADSVIFIGGEGKRDDHWYANYLLLYKALKSGIKAVMKTRYSDVIMFDKSVNLAVKKGYYFSIVPFDETLHIMNTEGLKYKITDKILHRCETLGISNETTDNTVKIEVKSGCGILFVTRQKVKIL